MTSQFKITIATIVLFVAFAALSFNQWILTDKVTTLQKMAEYRVVKPVVQVVPTVSPTASPTAALKLVQPSKVVSPIVKK